MMKISVQHAFMPISQAADAIFSVARTNSAIQSASSLFAAKVDRERADIIISFNPDGGTADFTEKTCTIGSYLGSLPTASRSDDFFEGWYSASGYMADYYTAAYQEVAQLTAVYTPATEVTFDPNGGTLIGQSTMRLYNGHPVSYSPDSMPTAQSAEAGMSFAGWYTDPSSGTKVNINSYYYGDYTVLYAHYTSKYHSVDLNSQWYLMTGGSTDPNGKSSPYQANPDSSTYDGVYASYSNYNVNNGWAKMRISFSGYDTFTFYIRSYAESNYDYTVAGKLDTPITSLPSQSTGSYSTYGNQKNGTAISYYTLCTYTTDGGSHFVDVVYRKDGSASSGNDRGYVLIPKN